MVAWIDNLTLPLADPAAVPVAMRIPVPMGGVPIEAIDPRSFALALLVFRPFYIVHR